MKGSEDVLPVADAVPQEGDDAARVVAYRRSLRAARVRRATARLRRRRVLRGRGSLLVATAGVLLASGGALAQKSVSTDGGGLSADTIATAQKALGVAADGVVGPRTRAAAKRFQRQNGLTADGVIGPQTLAALGVEQIGVNGARLRSAGPDGDPVLQRIPAGESGGEPTAVSPDGRYRGKYQFSVETWAAMGGSGDPAAAPEAEQDQRAAALLAQRGTAPWPVCGS